MTLQHSATVCALTLLVSGHLPAQSETASPPWTEYQRDPFVSPLPAAEIARRAFPSVVLLMMQDARGQPICIGSGFFVDREVVATNFHVIAGAHAGYAKIVGQPTRLLIKGIVGLDTKHDLALLQITTTAAPALPLRTKTTPSVGDAIYTAGNPAGLEGTFAQGIVSGNPIDSCPIQYKEIIPAKSAKRLTGLVDSSVQQLWTADYWWDSVSRVWHKGNAIPPKLLRTAKVQRREGKIEFRILDFTVL